MALKDNKIFRLIIIPISVTLCFIGHFIPTFGGLSEGAIQVLFIFLGCLMLWLTIGIDWPSLLCIFALGFVDGEGLGFKTIFKESFGNFTFIFLMFTFISTYALSKTGIIKRITLGFINSKAARKHGMLFSFLFLFAVLLIGLFTSPSVLFVVVLPLLNEIFAIAKIEKGEKIGKALLMGLGFTVSISSGMTPIAHVFPVLAMNAANIQVSTLNYMAIAVPVGLLVFGLMFLMLFVIYKPDYSKLHNIDASELKKDLPDISTRDILTLIIFAIVVCLWLIPDLYKEINLPLLKDSAVGKMISKLGDFTIAMPPLLGVILLCVIRVDGKPLIKVDEAFKNIPWSSLAMCAATICLGFVLTNDSIGIKSALQNNLSTSLGGLSAIVLLIIFALWAAIQTNLSSNMVTATLVATVASVVLGRINVPLNTSAVICIIGMLASFAFATPPSMPHIAIVAGSEHCSAKDVLIFGGILMFVSVAVAILVGYPLGLLVL